MQIVNTILCTATIACVIVGVCTSTFLFFVMLLRRSIMKTDKVGYLVSVNSYIAFIVASPIFIDFSVRSIYGQLHSNVSFDGWVCTFKAYVLYTSGCVYFFSFLLQSIYRFCRIVYPTRILFQSFRPYAIVSVGMWFLGAILLLPSYFIGAIEYLPEDYHCQFPTTDLRGSLVGLSIIFLMPFILTLICYFYTMYYVRSRTSALITINRYRNVRRDLIVLSRLVFLFTFITAVALPHVVIPIVYAITGYLPPWVVSFEWLLTVFSLTAACIIQIFVTPPLTRICIRNTRINPVTRMNPTHTWNRTDRPILNHPVSQVPVQSGQETLDRF